MQTAALSPCPSALGSLGEADLSRSARTCRTQRSYLQGLGAALMCGIHFPMGGLGITREEADSTAIGLPGGVGVGWGVPKVLVAFVTSLAMLKSSGLRTNQIRSQVDKTFARITASVNLLVGIQALCSLRFSASCRDFEVSGFEPPTSWSRINVRKSRNQSKALNRRRIDEQLSPLINGAPHWTTNCEHDSPENDRQLGWQPRHPASASTLRLTEIGEKEKSKVPYLVSLPGTPRAALLFSRFAPNAAPKIDGLISLPVLFGFH